MKLLNAGLIFLALGWAGRSRSDFRAWRTKGDIQHLKSFHMENTLMGSRWTGWSNEGFRSFNFHDSAGEVFENFPNPRQILLRFRGWRDSHWNAEKNCPWFLEKTGRPGKGRVGRRDLTPPYLGVRPGSRMEARAPLGLLAASSLPLRICCHSLTVFPRARGFFFLTGSRRLRKLQMNLLTSWSSSSIVVKYCYMS